MSTEHTVIAPTPNGGYKSVIYYQDAEGNPIHKSRAVAAEIIEYDSIDREIARTYGEIRPTTNWREIPTDNVFCPTGEGGGIDPTCSPGSSNHLSSPPKPTEEQIAEQIYQSSLRHSDYEVDDTADYEVKLIDIDSKPLSKAGFIEGEHPSKLSSEQLRNEMGDLEGLVSAYASGKPVPPISITKDDYFFDGRHRMVAARLAGMKKIWVLVKGITDNVSTNSNWKPISNAFCPTGDGGGIDPTCSPGESGGTEKGKPKSKKAGKKTVQPPPDPAKDRPSKPEERVVESPKVLDWVDPPPKQSIHKGKGVAPRLKGDESQTAIGDLAELQAQKLGFRDILPGDQRAHTVEQLKKLGSSIDLEYGHSGRFYEMKVCKTTATEYRMKAKSMEKKGKEKFARIYKGKPYVLLGVMDQSARTIHFYASKKPKLIGANVSPRNYDFVGKVSY